MIHHQHTIGDTIFGYLYIPHKSPQEHIHFIEKIYPQHTWHEVLQKHSTIIHDINEQKPPHADGMISSEKTTGLIIKTADCLPVMISTPHQLCAVHAGWRGLRDNIIPKCIALLRPGRKTVWLGPHHHSYTRHINDASVPSGFKKHIENDHVILNLSQLALKDFQDVDVIHNNQCTYSNPNLPSYRRGSSERLFNYVCRQL